MKYKLHPVEYQTYNPNSKKWVTATVCLSFRKFEGESIDYHENKYYK